MRVAVIGAGISGIVSLKSCLEEDIDVVCYEGSSHVGGLWAVESESCIMYDSLLTNTSKEGMAFSDFPPPTEWPSYITAAQVNEYILAYCSHFNLLDKIRLEHKILDISKTEDHDVSGQWLVTVHHNKETVVQTFDAVMVCTGISRFPFTPDYPNMNRFKGDIIHSAFYKNHTKFSKSQRILVIGNSSSGLDIAADLCKRKSKAVGLFGKGLRMLTNTVKSAAEEEYGKSGELDQAMSGLEAHSNVLNNAVQRTSDSTSPASLVTETNSAGQRWCCIPSRKATSRVQGYVKPKPEFH